MKKFIFYAALIVLGVIAWKSYDIAMLDPQVYAAGIITGIVLGAVASIPVGMLVLAATRNREDRAERQHYRGSPLGAVQPTQVQVLPPQPYGAYPGALPPGMQPPAHPGAWYSQGPQTYDLDINQ